MRTEKLVSIVMPTYNGEDYIEKSILPILEQSYRNIEFVIVDDGSTDSTLEICRNFALKDNRVHVIESENKGVSAARNLGIDNSHGDYIIFVDDDDYPDKTLIEQYVKAYEEWEPKKPAFIICGMAIENEFNKRVGDRVSVLESGRGYIEGQNYLLGRSAAAILAWLRLFNFVTNKCYDLKVIKDNNIRYDETMNIAEDMKFNLDYLDNCEGHIGMINSPLYHYIKRKGEGLSVKYHANDLDQTKEIYDRFVEWEKNQKGVTDDNISVLKALYINDWTNRLTAIFRAHRREPFFTSSKRRINAEIRSHKFRKMLHEVYRVKKISHIRFYCLNSGCYEIYYFFRCFYQKWKG